MRTCMHSSFLKGAQHVLKLNMLGERHVSKAEAYGLLTFRLMPIKKRASFPSAQCYHQGISEYLVLLERSVLSVSQDLYS